MNRIAVIVGAASLTLFCGLTYAGEPPVAILAGKWTYDATSSQPIDPDLRITQSAAGVLHWEGGTSAPYDFDLVGGSHPLSNGRTVVWTPTSNDTWRVTRARNGEVLETVSVTLSGSRLSYATRGKLPDGSPYERTTTYQRQGQGKGLIGQWRSVKVDTGNTWDGFVFSTTGDGVVTWRIPTDLQVIVGRFDGSELEVVGPTGPTGSTLAARVAGPGRFSYDIKNNGRITDSGTITVSQDRRSLTELTWQVDQPQRKSKLVYRRDPVS